MSSRPSSKKLLGAADGNHSRKPQLIQMERATDCGVPNLSRHLYNTAPIQMAQRTSQKRGRKEFKSQNREATPIKSHKFGHPNKTGTVAMWIGVNLARPYHEMKSYR